MRKAALIAMCAVLMTPAADAQVVARIVRASDEPTPSKIGEARDEYVAAVNTREADKIAALYTDDALVIPSEGVFLRGKTEITGYFGDALREARAAGLVTITPFAVTTAGNLRSETGSFEESRTTSAGTRAHVTGVYVIIYSREADGRWRIAMEVRTSGDSRTLVHW